MKRLFTNSIGSSILQVMIGGALVLGGATYVISNQQKQNKLQKGVSNKMTQSYIQREISEILADGVVCLNTFAKQNTLEAGDKFDGIYNRDGTKIYSVGSEIDNNTIADISLEDYTPSSGSNYQLASLAVSVESKESNSTSFGGKRRKYQIPIFLITENNIPTVCLSDGAGTVILELRNACEELGGSFIQAEARCTNFPGRNGSFITYLREELCAGDGPGCTHPYSGKVCRGSDVRGIDRGNWVVKGFDAEGNMQCACVPKQCPNPSQYCLGTDLGTNWCDRVCSAGNKTTGECAPECNSWTAWSPASDTTCNNQMVSQTRSCESGNNDSESRTVPGTMDCGSCQTWGAWSPGPGNTCSDQTLTQTRTCSSGSGTQTRSLSGTKDCGSCQSWGAWSPEPGNTCSNQTLTQTRTCSSGSGTQTRSLSGTKDCGCPAQTVSHSISATLSNGAPPHTCVFSGTLGPGTGGSIPYRKSTCTYGQVRSGGTYVGRSVWACVNGAWVIQSAACSGEGPRGGSGC